MTPLSYHGYSVSELSSQQCSGILLQLLCLFSSFLFHYKTFTRYLIIKYIINVKPTTSSHKIQAKTFTWPKMSFAPNKGIEQACSWASCDMHISPFSIIYTKPLAMSYWYLCWNCMVHKSGYCKCSITWYQVRPFLLFMNRTHPLQMKASPLQYVSTDRNKKSHYNLDMKTVGS